MNEIKKVYLAGKIDCGGWRQSVVNVDQVQSIESITRNGVISFPIREKAILDYFDYVGPYFIGGEHNITPYGAAHQIDDTREHDISVACLDAIKSCDIVIAYLSGPTLYGTVIELVYAALNKKLIYIVSSLEERRNYWFLFSTIGVGCVYVPYEHNSGRDDSDEGDENGAYDEWVELLSELHQVIKDILCGFIPKARIDYREYMKSPEWKARAKQAKDRSGWKCQLCNKAGSNMYLHAHHRTYENLGNEHEMDLTVLCSDCHGKFHDKLPH